MSYDRTDGEAFAWIKSVGSQEDPLEEYWLRRTDLCDWVWFSKYPRSVRGGDLLTYYAAGRRVFPAIVEVVSDRVTDDAEGQPIVRRRWRWRMGVRPHVLVPLTDAPSLEEVGVHPLRLRRQSHVKLEPHEYQAIRSRLFERIARATSLQSNADLELRAHGSSRSSASLKALASGQPARGDDRP